MTAGKNEAGVAGYILAGGGSARFGRDKALVEVGGR
ncbi:MAG: nucleotidyltransferase family protein, partial [Acidobacteria bacterium]